MLQQLHIQNYVLIEDLEMNISKGLTIITGETGAGKTILVGALSLILGQRADSSVLLNKSRKCIIEGQFEIKGYDLKEFFDRNELDFEAITTLRREISAEGKSRAFINDTPVNLNRLKELGSKLVDIHSQHETLTIQDSGFQLRVTDSFCNHESLLTSYKNNYGQYMHTVQHLEELIASENKSKADLDYYQFQYNELEQAKLKGGEQEILQQELDTLNNAEEIKSTLNLAVVSLQGGEVNIVNQLGEIQVALRSVAKYNPKVEVQAERIKSSLLEVKDIADELEMIEQHINYDPERIVEITERLNTIFILQQKHRMNSIDELLLLQDQLSASLLKINSLEDEIKHLKNLQIQQRSVLTKLAGQLSDNRKEAAMKIEKEMKAMLAEIGMPHAILKVDVKEADQFTESGIDKIKFLFSANKGVPMQELSKVASGGEMSRLMLCIKAMVARLITLPTIVFDEIDAGISGEIAFKVGNIIEKISSRHQVIVITHLPQMASRGDAHLLVFKKTSGKTTHTGIRTLDQQERVSEIAKMLSGDDFTDAALENAKELLSK